VSRPVADWRAALRAWSRRHGYSLLSSIGSLVRAPVASLMTITVLAIALSLPLGLNTALVNLEHMHRQFDRLDSISVFLALEIDQPGARRIGSRLAAMPEVAAVDPVSPEQGLEQLIGATGLDGQAIGDVPLPWVLEVLPEPDRDLAALAARLNAMDGIDQVVIDLDWVRRLEAILGLFGRLVALMAVLFAASVLFVIANNIRAEIEQRREEIEVLALVGATPGYIRRPFLYSGLWMALAGALLAWLLVRGGLWLLTGPVQRLAESYGSSAELVAPSPGLLGAMLAGSALLGVTGAWIAVSRQLKRINP